jgi:predicted  nucleic acid-binding Zn-ribbon protein
LKEQLRDLLQLQTIDAKVKELEATIKSLPTKLEPARRDLAKLETMLTAEKARIAENETFKKQQETLLEREVESMKSAKSKLSVSKTGKEFNAATREIDNKKRAIQEREGEIKKLREIVATTTEQAVAHETDVDAIRQSMAGDEADVAQRIAVLREEIAVVGAGREELRAKIGKQLLKDYDSLATKRGYSVAPVVKGVCQGCHTTLPPQMNNMLARGDTVERCPRCLRIVYRPETLEDKPEEVAPPQT